MRGNTQIISALNEGLIRELTGINQYSIHRAILAVQEYPKLIEYIDERIADERKHYDMLAERIRFLEGVPVVGSLNPVNVGEDIMSIHSFDLTAEYDAIQKYNETIQLCLQVGDSGTRGILETILSDEEDHARDLEAQLIQIAQMTTSNYLSAKL